MVAGVHGGCDDGVCSSLNKDAKAMESAYWPGNEKERVATELKRHGGMRYMMSGPWNETSCEYYEEIQQRMVYRLQG